MHYLLLLQIIYASWSLRLVNWLFFLTLHRFLPDFLFFYLPMDQLHIFVTCVQRVLPIFNELGLGYRVLLSLCSGRQRVVHRQFCLFYSFLKLFLLPFVNFRFQFLVDVFWIFFDLSESLIAVWLKLVGFDGAMVTLGCLTIELRFEWHTDLLVLNDHRSVLLFFSLHLHVTTVMFVKLFECWLFRMLPQQHFVFLLLEHW